MRRVVFVLLAAGVLAGVVAVIASGSGVAAHKTSRPQMAGSMSAGILAKLKSLKPAPAAPRNCSVAAGPCIEGCAMPIAGAVVTPRPIAEHCRSTPSRPCFELIAKPAAAPRAPFCTPWRPGVPLLESFRPRLRRQR